MKSSKKQEVIVVPPEMAPFFKDSEKFVSDFFGQKMEYPEQGVIEVKGERYILMRAASMSSGFFEVVKNLYSGKSEEKAIDVARQLLFDISHAMGKADAKNFAKQMKVKIPLAKGASGPIHFAFTGWALVEILPGSNPSPDENFYLIYDHANSFESVSWRKDGKKTTFPVCVMSAGYSSGWCEESFGVNLVASEIMCTCKGDKVDRFIMAPPSKIKQRIADYIKQEPELAKKIKNFEVPDFFEKKKVENELALRIAELEKMNKFFVNRELQMVKLKEEIEMLKERFNVQDEKKKKNNS